jgi:hypothetical protein
MYKIYILKARKHGNEIKELYMSVVTFCDYWLQDLISLG